MRIFSVQAVMAARSNRALKVPPLGIGARVSAIHGARRTS
jgi:hypothetical protein